MTHLHAVPESCREEAKRLYLEYTGNGRIDNLYGPSNARKRAGILSVLRGVPVPPSRAAWGDFRVAMMALYGIEGSCIAERESKLTRAANPDYDKQYETLLARLAK